MIHYRDRPWVSLITGCVLVMLPLVALGGDQSTVVELTAANTGFSSADDAVWGWWNPSKYDQWTASEDDQFGLAEARLEMAGKTYAFILGIELYPTIEALGILTDPDGEETSSTQISTNIKIFDLGYGQNFQTGSNFKLKPWLGLTHIRINEDRILVEDPTGSASDQADSRLWGFVVGAEGKLSVSQRWSITGRAVVRWARGDRDTVIQLTGTVDPPLASDANLSDKVTRAMWGADLGARWKASDSLDLEGGWRYRDWHYDDGPGSFSGPYLRLALGF